MKTYKISAVDFFQKPSNDGGRQIVFSVELINNKDPNNKLVSFNQEDFKDILNRCFNVKNDLNLEIIVNRMAFVGEIYPSHVSQFFHEVDCTNILKVTSLNGFELFLGGNKLNYCFRSIDRNHKNEISKCEMIQGVDVQGFLTTSYKSR